jgi:hypothetical protein
MTPILASTSSIEVPILTRWTMATPQIATSANVSNSPWLYSALTQVRDIEHAGELIPGLGDLRIAEQTAKRARMLLSSIDIETLPAPVVSPVSGGGLSITWALGLREVKFSVEPDGETNYFKVESDAILDDGAIDLVAANSVTKQLHWMLNGQA